ncbi:TPA: glycoside hydrolase, partial [Enterococcus faecium]|nr:glycoside hydrolase [Enterococcus faecium]
RYKNIACKLKESICKQMTIDGPFGEQFLEGIGDEEKTTYSVKHYQKPILEQGLIFLSDVIVDGKINLLMHDGEESDTTLMPFYQFLDNKDHLYQNTMAFSASSFNPTYSEEIKGITWGLESGATFPGFITVLMSELHNPQAFVTRLEELICLADLDGSWWWWPYRLEAQQGEVVRDFGCGKCGWASGLFVSLMISQYFGLKFKKGVLQIDPVDNLTFSWKNLKFGQAFISIECTQSELSISNLSEKPLKISDTKKILHVEKGKTIHIQR